MNRWRRWSLFTLFFLTFAFAGGGLFLLYGMLPLERWLVGAEWKQGEIDRFLSAFVGGWFLIAALVSLLYYRLALAPKWRKGPALSLVAASTLGAAAMFYIFMNTGLAMIASRAAKMEDVAGGKLTFGPYPDREQMVYLKANGIDGIIALLNRTVPFEGPLLDQEAANAKEVGMELHVLPMLPWISDNRASLEQARALLADGNKRYYVHCYLGQHRTNLIRALAAEMHTAPELERGSGRGLERGPLFIYEQGRILVGPFPTDEEWVGRILNHGVREVVSVVNRDTPDNLQWISKLKRLGETYGVTVVEKPLDPTFPDEKVIDDVARYVKTRSHKVFVVGFRVGNWTWAMDTLLGGNGLNQFQELNRDTLERGKLLRAGSLAFGPLPTDEEIATLRRAGFSEFLSVIDPNDARNQPWIEKERQWAKVYGFKLTHMPIPGKGYKAADFQAVSDYLEARRNKVYVHGFSADVRVEILHRLAQRFPQVMAAAKAAETAPGPQATPVVPPADETQKR